MSKPSMPTPAEGTFAPGVQVPQAMPGCIRAISGYGSVECTACHQSTGWTTYAATDTRGPLEFERCNACGTIRKVVRL